MEMLTRHTTYKPNSMRLVVCGARIRVYSVSRSLRSVQLACVEISQARELVHKHQGNGEETFLCIAEFQLTSNGAVEISNITLWRFFSKLFTVMAQYGKSAYWDERYTKWYCCFAINASSCWFFAFVCAEIQSPLTGINDTLEFAIWLINTCDGRIISSCLALATHVSPCMAWVYHKMLIWQ